ncbi:hypothetical protein H4R21_000651 [Coemansia helicoidea]|uniref:Uncharacterized protein n=1 Tax=Coemansia helicoidea TaxID=1286919 RepID=A0ACC1LFL8_9FUNG|nr:hypothetical protein H4R21_000651 [Coemansia helicoidea]
MYYRSADVWPHRTTFSNNYKYSKYITLGEIVETGNQRYLRDLRVHIYVSNYGRSWIEEIANLSKDVDGLIQQIRHQLPNVRDFSLRHRTKNSTAAHSDHLDKVLEKSSELFGDGPMRLALSGVSLAKTFVANTSGTMLRSIDITMPSGNQQHVEIVRRNAPYLEYLRVCKVTHFSFIKMTCDPRNKSDMLVYPRLRTLTMEYLTGLRSAAVREPLMDPFPRLQTLVCRGHFPFRSPGVLCGGHSHITHLDMDMDNEVLAVLDNCLGLERHTFSKLQCVSLGWAKNGRVVGMEAKKLYRLFADLGAQIQVARIPTSVVEWMADMVTVWDPSTNLTVLDAPQCEFDTDQCIKLLCSHPRLVKANITYTIPRGSYGSYGSFMPPLNVLTEYQSKYQSSTSNTRALRIHNVNFGSSRQAAEFLVLLADILDSITHIIIAPSCKRPATKILPAVAFAKKRKAYIGYSFHDRVLFTSGTDW